MIEREEVNIGKVEFDVIVNGECIEKTNEGLLAHRVGNNMAVVGSGIGPEFMANVVACLTAWLIKHDHDELLIKVMENMVED